MQHEYFPIKYRIANLHLFTTQFIVCTTFASAFFVLSSLDLIPMLIFSPLGALSILSTNVNMALDPLVSSCSCPLSARVSSHCSRAAGANKNAWTLDDSGHWAFL